jgi:phosphoglucosamine mutase
MGRIFGTDGVRGVAGVELTAQLAMDLAVAAVPVLAPAAAASGHAHRPSAVIGRDSRASGDFLEAAVVAGLASSGVDVLRLGVIPTPGVAYLTGALNADFGVVLSASHNPAADNGIKFFGRAGVKLSDQTEEEIEARLRAASSGAATASPAGGVSPVGFGRVTDAYSAHETYLDHLLATLPMSVAGQPPLHGMRVVGRKGQRNKTC